MIRSDANASAFALPAQGTVARCRLASFVASEARTMMSLKSFGRSRARRPDVDSAAQAGFPVAYMATRQDRDGRSIRHVCHERHHCWSATARGMLQTRRET
jgi:hypothetical protein